MLAAMKTLTANESLSCCARRNKANAAKGPTMAIEKVLAPSVVSPPWASSSA